MKVFCDFHGLFQIVRAPTRNDYLLDLAITDMTGAKASVLPRIADHNAVKIELPLAVVTETSVTRTVWHLKGANWKVLKHELLAIDWTPLRRDTSEDALLFFLQVLWTALIKHIPRREVTCIKSSHP